MAYHFERIPSELQLLTQWIVWRYEYPNGLDAKPTKVPYSPVHGRKASVTDPSDWSTFNDACSKFKFSNGDYSGIGFVLTAGDPYCFIDLDKPSNDEDIARQQRIYEMFDSYNEKSVSGEGLHIICKASIGRGARRGSVEIYTQERYATFTGDIFEPKPIVDRHSLAMVLRDEMRRDQDVYDGSEINAEQTAEDQVIVERMLGAANGVKARDIYEGRWHSHFRSQSEADITLLDFIAYYTQNRLQIERIFRAAPSYRPQKYDGRPAVFWKGQIDRALDRQLKPTSIDAVALSVERALAAHRAKNGDAEREASAPPNIAAQANRAGEQDGDAGVVPAAARSVNSDPDVIIPPGLVGDVARFIHSASTRPVWEISLTAAIGFIAGISARAFNVSRTGLNQYILLLAPTGTGKEAMNGGIGYLRSACPSIADKIGPSEIRSGPAFQKMMGRNHTQLSIAGEFGHRFKAMADERNVSEHMLKRMLADVYHKSGNFAYWDGSVYSDKDKNVPTIQAPAFTMLCESAPDRFFEALDDAMVQDGLLPRFTIFEYKGDRVRRNRNVVVEVPEHLVARIEALGALINATQAQNKVINVGYTEEAEIMLDAFDDECTDFINDKERNSETLRNLWNRAHLKALKLAATVAVGMNFENPVIGRDAAIWAIQLIREQTELLSGRFERGEVGIPASHDIKQVSDMISGIRAFMLNDAAYGEKYHLEAMYHFNRCVTEQALCVKLKGYASFRNDKFGALAAIKRAIRHLIDDGILQELGVADKQAKFGKTRRAFAVIDPERVLNEK